MNIHRLILLIILLISSAFSWARKPAVDPIIGVEPENYKSLAAKDVYPFNFNTNQNLVAPNLTKSTNNVSNQKGADSSYFTYFVLLVFLTIPFIMKHAIERKILKDISEKDQVHDPNVTSLAHFKENKENMENTSKLENQDIEDKAS